MVLSDFAMIAADTARSKAYIQAMIQGEKLPAMCIIYSGNCKRMEERDRKSTRLNSSHMA